VEQRAQDSLLLREGIKFTALAWHLLTGLVIYLFVRKQRYGAIAAALMGVPGMALPGNLPPGLSASVDFQPRAMAYNNGTHVCEVEVDRETGTVTVVDYVSVDDCGVRVSPNLVRGQVHGGLAQGIAQALWEEVVYTDDGQLMTGSLMDYAIPRAEDLPTFRASATVFPLIAWVIIEALAFEIAHPWPRNVTSWMTSPSRRTQTSNWSPQSGFRPSAWAFASASVRKFLGVLLWSRITD